MAEPKNKMIVANLDDWKLFNLAVSTVPRVYIYGAPGIGKSRAGLIALQRDGKSVWQTTLNEDIVVQELIGHFVPEGNVFTWHNGPITQAFCNGDGLVINELARASGSVKDMFLGILDDHSVASLSLPNKKTYTQGDGFKVVATSNTPPDELDEALVDRFDVILHIKMPHPDIINVLNQAKPGFGDCVYDSYLDSKRAISPRRAFAFLHFIKNGVSTPSAALLSFGDRSDEILQMFKLRKVQGV